MDPELKERLHEAYYSLIPILAKALDVPIGPSCPAKEMVAELREKMSGMENMVLILVKYILEIENPDYHELHSFIVRHSRLLMDRLERILDKEEIKIQVKRRGLLR